MKEKRVKYTVSGDGRVEENKDKNKGNMGYGHEEDELKSYVHVDFS